MNESTNPFDSVDNHSIEEIELFPTPTNPSQAGPTIIIRPEPTMLAPVYRRFGTHETEIATLECDIHRGLRIDMKDVSTEEAQLILNYALQWEKDVYE